MAVDGSIVHVDVLAVGGVDQLVAALDVTGTAGQCLQEQELGHRDVERAAPPRAQVARRVQHEVAAAQDVLVVRLAGFLRRQVAPAQQRPDTLDQQPLGERFLDVVVGAHAQAQHLVDLVVLGGEEDHRHVRFLADLAQQLHAVHARHLDVEYGEVGGLAPEPLERLGASRIGAHPESLVLEGHGYRGQDVAVVVDEDDGVGHRLCLQLPKARHLRHLSQRFLFPDIPVISN